MWLLMVYTKIMGTVQVKITNTVPTLLLEWKFNGLPNEVPASRLFEELRKHSRRFF